MLLFDDDFWFYVLFYGWKVPDTQYYIMFLSQPLPNKCRDLQFHFER